MTKLDKFVAFARELPAEQQEWLDVLLEDIMASHACGDDFTTEEIAEIDRRAAEENPEYANPDDIAAILGKKFS